MAECLYSGIITDTGSFKFSSTNSETHIIVSKLIDFKQITLRFMT